MYYTLHCARFQPFRSSGTPCQSCQSSLRLQSWCAEPLYFPVIWQWSRTLTSFSTFCFLHIWLISKHFLLILAHSHWLIKFTLDYFPAIFFLLQHLLHKFFNGILYSVNLHWFWIFVIIAAHDFVTITTSCTLLTFVCIWFGIFWMASLYFFGNGFKIGIYYKRYRFWYLFRQTGIRSSNFRTSHFTQQITKPFTHCKSWFLQLSQGVFSKNQTNIIWLIEASEIAFKLC